MDEICGLKSHLVYEPQYFLLKYIAKEIIFITELAILW